MTKELAETLRRTSHEKSAGILHFSYFTWFQSPWSARDLKPWPAYYALKKALRPVLVSAELFDRHFYSDTTFHARVCIVNDSESGQRIPSGSHLIWQFQHDGQVLSQGKVETSAVDYYGNRWLNVEFKTPQSLPTPRIDGQLVLKLESEGKIISENSYDVVIATPDWAKGVPAKTTRIFLWNPGKQSVDGLSDLAVTHVDSVEAVDPANVLIVGDLRQTNLSPSEMQHLAKFVSQGGRVLMLHPGNALPSLFPDRIKAFKAKEGEIVTMHVPESPVFSGIEPLDTAWFDRGGRRVPAACTGVYEIVAGRNDITALAGQCDLHGYLKTTSEITNYMGEPLVELQVGKGHLIASELNLEAGKSEPIAHRLLMNLIGYLEQ